MDCVSSIKTTQALPAAAGVKSHGSVSLVPSSGVGFSTSLRKQYLIYARQRSQALIVAVANAEPRGFKNSGVYAYAPLEPTSPEGIFLSAILQNHRSLFSFAVSEQLGELASKRDEAAAGKLQNTDSMESILHSRIAEMKEKECQNGVEDVIYMSIVHKFSKAGVPMLQKLSESITDNTLEIWPSRCRELESIHNLEVQELILGHVDTILRTRGKSFLVDDSTTTMLDKLNLGRIYAASILYGYFLKSACFRRKMDTSLIHNEEDQQQYNNNYSAVDSHLNRFQSLVTLDKSTDTQLLEMCRESRTSGPSNDNLRSYVMGFDAQTLQRCAKLKSQEAVNVIEKQTWALFGDDNTSEPDSDSKIAITFPSLERLVLEAVAFGTFLWDVERTVDSSYTLQKN